MSERKRKGGSPGGSEGGALDPAVEALVEDLSARLRAAEREGERELFQAETRFGDAWGPAVRARARRRLGPEQLARGTVGDPTPGAEAEPAAEGAAIAARWRQDPAWARAIAMGLEPAERSLVATLDREPELAASRRWRSHARALLVPLCAAADNGTDVVVLPSAIYRLASMADLGRHTNAGWVAAMIGPDRTGAYPALRRAAAGVETRDVDISTYVKVSVETARGRAPHALLVAVGRALVDRLASTDSDPGGRALRQLGDVVRAAGWAGLRSGDVRPGDPAWRWLFDELSQRPEAAGSALAHARPFRLAEPSDQIVREVLRLDEHFVDEGPLLRCLASLSQQRRMESMRALITALPRRAGGREDDETLWSLVGQVEADGGLSAVGLCKEILAYVRTYSKPLSPRHAVDMVTLDGAEPSWRALACAVDHVEEVSRRLQEADVDWDDFEAPGEGRVPDRLEALRGLAAIDAAAARAQLGTDAGGIGGEIDGDVEPALLVLLDQFPSPVAAARQRRTATSGPLASHASGLNDAIAESYGDVYSPADPFSERPPVAGSRGEPD